MVTLKNKKIISIIALAIIICVVIAGIIIMTKKETSRSELLSPEIVRSKAYDKVEEGEEAIEQTENVQFDAFFLRDLDGDGYAEGIRGTCKEIGKEDTLYMEINVLTAGVLKNAKITINNQNFYLQTSLPKDEELKDNYIGTNTKVVEFNDLSNGTQKLIKGFVRSGDYTYSSGISQAIGTDTSKYSKANNQVVFTGTYVTDEGEEIEISKTVDFTVDWYGTTEASLTSTTQTNEIADAVNEEEQTFEVDFSVNIQETKKQLQLSKLYVEGTIPELNGYAPREVKIIGSKDTFNYDEITRQFSIERQAVINENGIVTTSISRSNTYKLQVIYPLEAYESMGTEEISIKIPVKGYYEGYNNPNEEFTNPYKSNVASSTIVVNVKKPAESETDFSLTVGKYVTSPTKRYLISKQKPLNMYNGKSENETDDTYLVTWRAYIGTNAVTDGIIMKENLPDSFIKTNSEEESMENITTYKGIYFGNITNILGEEGYIKVYNDETGELIQTFDKSNVNKYSSSKPYYYEMPIKRIRIETSNTINDQSLYVYNIKQLDDENIIEKYTREEFDNLQYIKSTLDGQVGTAHVKTTTNQANYEESISIAEISISNNTISTQKTEENNKITIQTKSNEEYNQVNWVNGAFLIKLPEEILELEINDVTIDNEKVTITSYEILEQDGSKFIKILTTNDEEASYKITIDVNITPDPRKPSSTKTIELYASNENGSDYYYKSQDIYDVNNNANTEEIVNKASTNISLVSPGSLLTNQIGSEYDEKGTVVISPQIAEIKPQVAVVDQELPEKTAKVGIQLKNNYSNTISEVVILGKIPFEGNTYVLSGRDLGSEFTTKMTSEGIELPEQVVNYAEVYYSENTNPSKDLTDESNGWKTAENIQNWDNIKTFIIDLSDYIMPQGEELVFNYVIKIPNGLEYNKVSYSHHGVYFSLDTEEGKYRTQTEPNRIGFKIAEKYNLNLIKYQKGKENLVPGATYRIIEEGETEGKTALTNEQGELEFKNLYVEKTYLVEEIKVPTDYELNTDVVKIIGHVNRNMLTIEKLAGETKESITVEKLENEDYKVILKVEDEAKARLNIIKKEQGTETAIQRVKFKVTGADLPESGKILTTSINGKVSLSGLKINEEYTLQETKATGYYLAAPIKFKIVNNNGTYEIQVTEGTISESNVTEEENLPTINLIIENEKIPTYDLELIKIKKTTDVNLSETEGEETEAEQTAEEITYLQGAKFKLYKNEKEIGEYITGEDGKVTISGLYQYIEEKEEEATYKLKETLAPEGYAKVKDIVFKVQAKNGTLTFINIEGEEEKYTVEDNTVKLTIEDSPSFKLIKKDGETGELLANIKFAIYNVDDGLVPATNSKGETLGTKEVINGREYYTLTTDQNGEITADLKEGTYKAVELKAPDKYDISNSTYYFGIGASIEPKKSTIAEWAKSISGQYTQTIMSSVETTDGGYIVGGYFNGKRTSLGNGVTLYNTKHPGFGQPVAGMIIKYSSSGEVEWAKAIEGLKEYILSVSETADGGYIAGGYFQSSLDLGNGVTLNNNGSYDGMIIKYSSSGETEWAKAIGGSDNDNVLSVSATSDGGIIVGGYFQSSIIDLGNEVVLNNNGSYDGMIIKYSSSGETEWAKAIGGSSADYIYSVSAISNGGIIVGGYFQSSTIELENEVILNNSGSYDGIIIKYSSSGKVEWERTVGGSDSDYIYSVSETADGGIIVGGTFISRTIELENGISLTHYLSSASNNDGMIIKYSSSGETEWAKAIGGSDNDNIRSLSETTDGGYIVGGFFESSSINLGNGITLSNYYSSSGGNEDGMVIKYSRNGEAEWARKIGGAATDTINSISETTDGGFIIGGAFGSSINLGNGIKLSSISGSDGMIIKILPIEIPNVIVKQIDQTASVLSVTVTSDGGMLAGTHYGITKKYSSSGEVEWERNIGGAGANLIRSVSETTDGGYIVGGYFKSSTIDLGNGVTLNNNGSNDGMIIKYSRDGETEWAKAIGGSSEDYIYSVSETTDGGYIVGGYFKSSTIDLGDGVALNNNGSNDGVIIKYSSSGDIEWAKAIGGSSADYIYSVSATSNGGFIIGGSFRGYIDLGNGVTLNTAGGYSDGMIIKYSSNGEAEWARTIGNTSNNDEIKSVAKTSDGGIIAVGNYGTIKKYSSSGEVEWEKVIGSSSNDSINTVTETIDGGYVIVSTIYDVIDLENGVHLEKRSGNKMIKFSKTGEAEWAQNIGDSAVIGSIDEISDGAYVIGARGVRKCIVSMGAPEIQELVVENTRKEFQITTDIKEIDGIKGGIISGEDEIPYETVKYGDTNSNPIIMTPEKNHEIIGITINGKEYKFTANEDGTYTMPPFGNITENKHIEVTYSLKDNKIIINKIDSDTQEKLSGATFKLDQIEEREKPSGAIGSLTDNGKEYYYIDTTNEITDALGTLTDNGTYYFASQDGKYVPTNSKTYQIANVEGATTGVQNSVANSYIPIDLTQKQGKYMVVINASVSSQNGYDYGYATINQTTTAPKYNNSTGRFMYISGTVAEKDYTSVILEGGNQYYLHLGYRKSTSTDTNDDQVVINSIKLYGTTTETYNFINSNGSYESTNQGKDNTVANSYVEIDLSKHKGKYNLIVNANISSQSGDYGYVTIKDTNAAPVYSDTTGRLIYITGTTNAVTTPTDYTTTLEGGNKYYLHFGYYKNASTSSGDDKFTINSIELTLNDSELYHTEVTTNSQGQAITQIPFGKYSVTEIVAPKGYELNENAIVVEFRADGNHEFTIENRKLARVIVHHYIKGTETKVAEDQILVGKDGENYTTAPYMDLAKYTLEKDIEGNYIIPEKAIGTYKSGDQEVTYYYEPKKVKLTVHHYIDGTETPVPLVDGTTATDIVSEGEEGEPYKTEAITQEQLGENYLLVEVPENSEGTYQGEEVIVTYYYKQRLGKVIVHHYIQGTTTKLSKDIEKIGVIDENYETQPATDIPEYYELVQMPENYTGKIKEEETEVIYYYKLKKYEYSVEYYFEEVLDETLTDKFTAEYGSKINTYVDKVKQGYHFDKSENLSLTITTNPEENVIKIYYKKNYYDITTEVEGVGGSISGQGEEPYETVLAKYDSTKDIIVTPEKGYVVKEIKINEEIISYVENADGTVTLNKFTKISEDKHVVASFRKLFTIIKQGEEETVLLPGAKFTIKDEKGNDVIDRKGEVVGTLETINGQELKVITTDEEGRIDLNLNPGKYIITEVQAPSNYALPENEEDRTYIIEIGAAIKEERELKEKWSNIIPEKLYNFDILGTEVSKDKGLIISGGILEETIIDAENTTQNKDIVLTNVGIEDGVIIHTDEYGKASWIKQIKSDNAESANMIINAIQLTNQEYIAMGIFMGTITIPAEETVSEESISITSISEGDTFIIKYNKQGKVEWVRASEKYFSGEPIIKLKATQNDEFIMSRQFEHFEVSGENTVSGEDIILDATTSGMLIVKYNEEGKVEYAKESLLNEDLLNQIYYSSITFLSDGGYIISGDTDYNDQIIVPAEDTTDGIQIIIEKDENKQTEAIAIKCDSEGKIEYIKKINNEKVQSDESYLLYINETSEGYVALEESVKSIDDGTRQYKRYLLQLNSKLEIENMVETSTESYDVYQIEQMSDGSFTMLYFDKGNAYLANYTEEIVQVGVPADAPTLTVTNELESYEYKVEYYYDGKIDESQTEILKEKYGKIIEEYEEKTKEAYILEKTENLPLTITDNTAQNIIKIYYVTKIEKTVTKIWDDSNNRDEIRPENIEVQLYADGVAIKGEEYKVILNESNNWTYTWTNLPKYKDGKEIKYSMQEETMPKGYEVTYSEDTFTITNTHISENTEKTVTKIWEDANNQDGIRPENVEVQLYADGIALEGEEYKVTLNKNNNWSHTWPNLQKNKKEQEIKYTVQEVGTLEGYKTTYSEDTFTITNTHIPETTERAVIKVWEDANNQDGIRPESIEVQLYANDVALEESKYKATLDESNNWSCSWYKLPKNKNGKEIKYTVKEVDIPEGYEATYSEDTFTITNTHIPYLTEKTVTKVWDDENNQDGIRPESIEVQLFANYKKLEGEIYKITLNKNNNWTYTWTNLPKNYNGQEIIYTVQEENVPDGYEVTYNDETLTITNKRNPDLIEKTVTKIWNDGNNQDGIRPENIEVQLYANNTPLETQNYKIELNEDNNWSYKWTNLPKNKEGKEIVYTVREVSIPKEYEVTYSEDTFTITNAHIPYLTEKTVTKIWDDGNNQDGIRPESVEVQLFANYKKLEEEVYKITLDERNNWSYTWTNLPKNNNGEEIVYTVQEEILQEQYEVKYSEDTFTITNIHKPEVISKTVTKIWEDGNNQDGIRPENIEVQLYADGAALEGVEYKITLNENNNWKHIWNSLPKYKDGKEIKYTIGEVSAPTGYETSYSEDTFTITNSHTPETIQKTVTKIWKDNDNQDGIRPESIEVQLYADGAELMGNECRVKLNEDNNWSYTWNSLPKNKEGKTIRYTLQEVSVPEGYEVSYSEDTFTITNEHDQEITEKTVIKIWDDNNDQDGLRPESIQVQLFANYKILEGEEYKVTLSESNNWSYTWSNLPKNKQGQEIVYTVQEIDLLEHYEVICSKDSFIITNIHEILTTDVSVEKMWNDNNNQYMLRPNSVKVALFANGVRKGNEIQLDDSNNWKFTWGDLPLNKDGKPISYTVKEINAENEAIENNEKYNDDYITTYVQNGNNVSIINTQKTFDLKLIKYISEINNIKVENRIKSVDLSALNTYDVNTNQWVTTGKYVLDKEPIKVEAEDYITYTIRIYNEGDYDGYATEIFAKIPEELEFVEVSDIKPEEMSQETYEKVKKINAQWNYNKTAKTLTTDALSERLLKGYGKENIDYADKQNNIDYAEVSVILKVKAGVEEAKLIINEAAISQDKAVDENGKIADVSDRDSVPTEFIETEDDEDQDNIIIKIFDLSLRKGIVQIENLDTKKTSEYSRGAVLDTNSSKTNTIYNYYNKYESIPGVEPGDLVTYSIVVYNEGEQDGYASLITDTLPSGLEFYSSIYKGVDYGWKLVKGSENKYQTDYLSYEKDVNKGKENSTILKAYTGEGEASYQELYIVCKVKEDITKQDSLLNVAQITENSNKYGEEVIDTDSIPGNTDDIDKWQTEDDLDIEILELHEFDLTLKQFITEVENQELTVRVPIVRYDRNAKQMIYTHVKDTLTVHVGDTIIYTIRVYNEGDIDGYAKTIKNDIPEYLEYLPEHSINVENEWVMYNKDGKETDDVEKATYINTSHLAKGKGVESGNKETNKDANLIKAFDPNERISETNPHYKEIKVAFKVKDPNSIEYEIVNFVQIAEISDRNGDKIKDKDSIPNNGEITPKEDDEDVEKIKVEYFDLSLQKYITKIFVNENGQERTSYTENTGNAETDIVPHVQISKHNINKTVIKFAYTIKVTNEGQISGEVTEITDYVPEGLVFMPEDNTGWVDKGNNEISTKQLSETTLQAGESAEVEVILTWENGVNTLGTKVNMAEISEFKNYDNVLDRDSTPNNKKYGEDDTDTSTVLLSVNQGGGIQSIYINLIIVLLLIILVGGIAIKKFVL